MDDSTRKLMDTRGWKLIENTIISPDDNSQFRIKNSEEEYIIQRLDEKEWKRICKPASLRIVNLILRRLIRWKLLCDKIKKLRNEESEFKMRQKNGEFLFIRISEATVGMSGCGSCNSLYEDMHVEGTLRADDRPEWTNFYGQISQYNAHYCSDEDDDDESSRLEGLLGKNCTAFLLKADININIKDNYDNPFYHYFFPRTILE